MTEVVGVIRSDDVGAMFSDDRISVGRIDDMSISSDISGAT